jgi:hypothetical protein
VVQVVVEQLLLLYFQLLAMVVAEEVEPLKVHLELLEEREEV